MEDKEKNVDMDTENAEEKEEQDYKEDAEDNTEDTEESKIEELEKKAADFLDKYQRTLAEFDNFRKRTVKEKSGMYDDGVRDSVLKLIPVVDNFERAVAAVSDEEKESALYKGIEMVLKQFTEILESLGVSEIEAMGKSFDPNLHNAVMHVDDDNFGENEVINVLQKGYICREKVIRPSMVQVAN